MAATRLSPDLSPLSSGVTSNNFPAYRHNAYSLTPHSLPEVTSFPIAPVVKTPHDFLSHSGPAFFNQHGFMIADEKSRPRNMSQSSSDLELSTDVKPALLQLGEAEADLKDNGKINPRKRSSADPIDYPRRRATIACEICRSRKSRCDGTRPKCRLCTELNAECVYREPGIKLDAGDKLILERLNRIESMLQENSSRTSSGAASNSPSTACSPIDEGLTLPKGAFPVGALGALGNAPTTGAPSVSTIPKAHTTPALNLLSWPMIRDLVLRRWDPKVLVQLETQREPLKVTSSLPLDFSNAQLYTRSFFEGVNVWYACVNPYKWNVSYHIAHSQRFQSGSESCLVLLVLALGSASASGTISRLPQSSEPAGLSFFAAAWAILPELMTRTTIEAAQCQILAAAYLFYMVRPLEAWNVLVSASVKLQLLVNEPLSPPDKRLCERVYWNALLFESDLLAELELPHSGIAQLEDIVGLPGTFEEDEEQPAGRDDLWYFLAEIALRRLLNRVSNSIYTKSSPITNTAALEPIVAELDSQLTKWYNGLPQPVQFELHGRPQQATPVQTVLRLRYYACRTIIYRPYVLAVLINEGAFMDRAVEEGCRICLEACLRQLEQITVHQDGHLPYLWQGALSIVSQTLLVMGATMSPSLATLLPPPPRMNAILDDVAREIECYGHLAPSLRLSADIIRETENRRRMTLLSPSMTSRIKV